LDHATTMAQGWLADFRLAGPRVCKFVLHSIHHSIDSS
jgi:hypothetical protein